MDKMILFTVRKQTWNRLMLIVFVSYGITSGNNEVVISNIEVLVNDVVSIHCYTNASIDIQWHFNSFLTYVFAGGKLRHPYNERLRTEDDHAGTNTLIIPKVRSEDAGWYYCQEELSGRLISSTHLTVLYSNPVCHSNMHPDGFIGPNTCNLEQENMVFNCVVSFNGLSPHLMWRLLNDNRTLNSPVCEDKPNRRNCSLILKPDPIYDGSIFICQLTTSMDSIFNCSTEVTKIQYIFATNDTAKKYVNDNVNCSVKSNLNVKYKWTLQESNTVSFLSSKQTLLIEKPGLYHCEVNYSLKNYSCITLASFLNVSAEITESGTKPGTAALAAIFSIGFVFVVLCTGMFILIRKRRKRKRENRRREDERRENERRENERIRNKIEGMYKDFVLDVDPRRVLHPLIQKRLISNEDVDNVLNKETTEDSCRALLDHLSSSPHREAFIVLKGVLRHNYPTIADRIDAIDNSHVTKIQENEIIKDKVVSIYIDFTSEVDPKNITFDHLIQSGIVSIEEKQRIMNKYTAEEQCRALVDHLFICSKENAFIILREALKECYPNIVERIDASDEDNEAEEITIAGKQENERIRSKVVAICEEFASEVDPKKILDFLIQNKIVNIKQIHHLKNQVTTEDQCKALLDLLFSCSKDNVFIILKEALKEHYPRIVERIDSPNTDDEFLNNPNRRSTMRLESSIIVFGITNYGKRDTFKINLNRPDEVSVLQQLPIEVDDDMAAAVYCGSVFVTGIGKGCDEIWRFDARSSQWKKCASLIKVRLDHSAAFVDHSLYICGGRGLDCGVFNDVQTYDAIDDQCSLVGKLSYAVQRAGNCVPYKASLYIFGGSSARNEHVNSVQVYNTKLNSCTILANPMPRNEAHLCAALFKNYAILLGDKSCFLYNFDTKTCEERDQFKSDGEYFGMSVHNENLFLIGCRDSQGFLRDDVRYVPIVNILNDEPIAWKIHSYLPRPFEVYAFGKLEILVKHI